MTTKKRNSRKFHVYLSTLDRTETIFPSSEMIYRQGQVKNERGRMGDVAPSHCEAHEYKGVLLPFSQR